MLYHHTGRYSKYIRPINFLFDWSVILVLGGYFYSQLNLPLDRFLAYQTAAWVLSAYMSKYYEIYRFTLPVEIISKIVKQGFLFMLLTIAYFPFEKQAVFSGQTVGRCLLVSFVLITLFKYALFYYLKKYRIMTGSNFRNAVIIGYSDESRNLRDVFLNRSDYGYRFLGFFSDQDQGPEVKGNLMQLRDFVLEKSVDDIYCSLKAINNDQLKSLVEFADEHQKTIKFIPDTDDLFSKNLKIDYYELFPVLSLQKTQLHDPFIKGVKRCFDIVFGLLVIVLVLSWLTPIMALLIKLESRGPIFFKQGRPGLDEKEFFCYKFRSMYINDTTEQEASKNDPRVTRMGRFMRKTSVDELPQFFNVLLGDMSVVGPRPHLWSQNKAYASRIKKYMVRLYVKPGITGLAQVKGYRGEIETEEDMVNRIKFDVFYIENWSMILDLKIILQTVINIFKGEEKAY